MLIWIQLFTVTISSQECVCTIILIQFFIIQDKTYYIHTVYIVYISEYVNITTSLHVYLFIHVHFTLPAPQTTYGDLLEGDGEYGGSKGRRWRIDWNKTPQPIEVKLRCLRGIKDKVPSWCHYEMEISFDYSFGCCKFITGKLISLLSLDIADVCQAKLYK